MDVVIELTVEEELPSSSILSDYLTIQLVLELMKREHVTYEICECEINPNLINQSDGMTILKIDYRINPEDVLHPIP